ncbi:hypothetical protein PssvBMR2_gp55 [Pseudomonas phage MR2]|uniref:Uncharacterized protein n=1 Tax=Pseudomonas phage MR2 TaxID=2711170 RepID=A0A6M3T907_9CAUD|nr:hypothetical protein PssvBMR2_gp55 [Pseudomonas phage MR2]
MPSQITLRARYGDHYGAWPKGDPMDYLYGYSWGSLRLPMGLPLPLSVIPNGL